METDLLGTIFPVNAEQLRHVLRHDREKRLTLARAYLCHSIAAQVKALRSGRKLTQESLASLSGTKQPKISELEKGDPANWETESLHRLAKAFKVRLKLSFETFGSLVQIAEHGSGWTVPAPPESDLQLQTPRNLKESQQLRVKLLDPEYRLEYSSTAVYEDLAVQLRAIRRQRGLTQEGLAVRADKAQPKLSGIENPFEQSELPNWETDTILEVGLALGVRLNVEFLSFATFIDDVETLSSDSLRREAPNHDSLLHEYQEPMVDQNAPERTQWMQTLMFPWLRQERTLGIAELLEWLQGKGLPPVGHDDPPYQWILRGLPAKSNNTHGYLELKLAERLAVVLGEQPDVDPVVEAQDDEFLAGLYWTCAGVNCPGVLGEPLWEAYKRLKDTKLNGPVLDALQAAIVQNQFGDKPYKEIWKPMVETGRHAWLRGTEVVGFEGMLVRHRRLIPDIDSLFAALDHIVRRWQGDIDDQRALSRLMTRAGLTDPKELNRENWLRLRRRSANWPAWTDGPLQKVKKTHYGAEVRLQAGEFLRASWQPGRPARMDWLGKIEVTMYTPTNERVFENEVRTRLGRAPNGALAYHQLGDLCFAGG